MDEIKQLRAFVNVVKAGSFSGAAEDTSSVSSVSRQIKALEEELGASLFNRNSRRLSLTEAGERLYERALLIVNDLDSVKSEIRSLNEDTSGTLRVCLRLAPGLTTIVSALPKFAAKYPKLSLDMVLTDKRLDLIENKLDVAVWLGELPDSDNIARKLCTTNRILCATPQYLEKHGVPETPESLMHHQCLVYTAPGYRQRWLFKKGDETMEVPVGGQFRADNGPMLLQLALMHLGVVIHPMWMVGPYIDRGELVRVLPEYTPHTRLEHADMFVVFPSTRSVSRKVRAFVDFLVEEFK